MYMTNRKICAGDPTQPIFHQLVFGVRAGVTQIIGLPLGLTQILAFLDTNMKRFRWWSNQHDGPAPVILHHSGIKALDFTYD